MNHVDKYYWIIDHPAIGNTTWAQATIELTPHMVNPENDTIEMNASLNTKFQWWVELSKIDSSEDEHPTHFWELDCGGDTAEEAINTLYELVLAQYGEYNYD